MNKLEVLKVQNEALQAQIKVLNYALENAPTTPDCNNCPTNIGQISAEGNFFRAKVPEKLLKAEVERAINKRLKEIKEQFRKLTLDDTYTKINSYSCEDCQFSCKPSSPCLKYIKFIESFVMGGLDYVSE